MVEDVRIVEASVVGVDTLKSRRGELVPVPRVSPVVGERVGVVRGLVEDPFWVLVTLYFGLMLGVVGVLVFGVVRMLGAVGWGLLGVVSLVCGGWVCVRLLLRGWSWRGHHCPGCEHN